jgi:molybdate transport system permease protein
MYTSLKVILQTFFSDEIVFALKLSLLTATASTIMALTVAIPSAYALSRFSFFGKNALATLFSVPLVLPPVAMGASLLIFLTSTPLGYIIENFFKFVFNVHGIILAQFIVIMPLALWSLKSSFDAISPRYEQVAMTLGYGRIKAIIKTTLPLARSGILTATVLSWARAIGEFGATVTLAGATPMKTETLPIAIYLTLSIADLAKTCAVIVILMCIALLSLFLIQRAEKILT